MNLTVMERVVLFNLLPEKGTFTTVRAVHDLRMALPLTEEERDTCGFQENEQGVGWQTDFEADIPINVEQFRVCKEALTGLDRRGELTLQHVSLYEKFVEREALVTT